MGYLNTKQPDISRKRVSYKLVILTTYILKNIAQFNW